VGNDLSRLRQLASHLQAVRSFDEKLAL